MNAFRDTLLALPPTGAANDPADDFSIGHQGIITLSLPLRAGNPANQESDVFFIKLDYPANPVSEGIRPPQQVLYRELDRGTSSHACLRFSEDGYAFLFLRRPLGATAAGTRVFMSKTDTFPIVAFDLSAAVIGKNMDLIPQDVAFSPTPKSILFTANDSGRRKLWELKLEYGASPRYLTEQGSVTAFHPIPSRESGRCFSLLVSSSCLIKSCVYTIIDMAQVEPRAPRLLPVGGEEGDDFGLSQSQIAEIYVGGHGKPGDTHCWLIRPSSFDSTKQYPVVLMLHGDPSDGYLDEWHWRVSSTASVCIESRKLTRCTVECHGLG